jgi:Cof subfamily protein (haloacid dehalogenase superfamily)
MTAMEPPISFDADAVRAKKTEVIQAIKPLDPALVLKDVVRGQYDAGRVLGKQVRAYRQEPDVAPNSTTETYIACKLSIDNWRWAGVPFYLRTGKYMKRRSTEIAIRFHQAPYALFRGTNVERMHPNWMILRIQPDEGIALEFAAKHPGPTMTLNTVSMERLHDRRCNAVSARRHRRRRLAGCAAHSRYLGKQSATGLSELCRRQRRPRRGRRVAGARWLCVAAARRNGVRRPMAGKRKISLVLADVDGTLVTEEKILTKRARDAVNALQDAGIRFAITSGRPPLGMAMLFDALDIETPIAGFNGGLFVKRDLSILEQKTVPTDVAQQAIDLMRAHGLDTWVYSGNDWLITKAVAPHVAREAWTVKFQPKVVPDVRTHLQQVAKVVGVSDDLDEVQRCEAEAQAAFSQRATANRSQPYYLDVTNKDANKGAVVEYLAQHVGVPAEEIATIGDQPNDVLMFKRSGFSIAMGNASDEVKAQAAAVTDSYNDEGFAKAMEAFILGAARQ